MSAKSANGFVLLHTLWLIMLLAALIAAALLLGRRAADQVVSQEQRLRQEAATESAVIDVVFELLEQGPRSRWLQQTPGRPLALNVDGEQVQVAVINVHGLIDIHSAEGPARAGLAVRFPGLGAGFTRGVHTYPDLRLPPHTLACLYDYITLFSGRVEPDPRLSPARLNKLLGRAAPTHAERSAMEDSVAVSGEVFRIDAIAPASGGRRLSAELLLTGQRDFPYVVRSWLWLPTCRAD